MGFQHRNVKAIGASPQADRPLPRYIWDMRIIARSVLAPLALASAIGVAHADNYPVSGIWTYENANQSGPAKSCNPKKSANFKGPTRLDTGTSAPEYKNVSVTRNGANEWKIVDTFYTLQIWGRVSFSLRVLDSDHIEIQYDRISQAEDRGPGKVFLLRRCES